MFRGWLGCLWNRPGNTRISQALVETTPGHALDVPYWNKNERARSELESANKSEIDRSAKVHTRITQNRKAPPRTRSTSARLDKDPTADAIPCRPPPPSTHYHRLRNFGFPCPPASTSTSTPKASAAALSKTAVYTCHQDWVEASLSGRPWGASAGSGAVALCAAAAPGSGIGKCFLGFSFLDRRRPARVSATVGTPTASYPFLRPVHASVLSCRLSWCFCFWS